MGKFWSGLSWMVSYLETDITKINPESSTCYQTDSSLLLWTVQSYLVRIGQTLRKSLTTFVPISRSRQRIFTLATTCSWPSCAYTRFFVKEVVLAQYCMLKFLSLSWFQYQTFLGFLDEKILDCNVIDNTCVQNSKHHVYLKLQQRNVEEASIKYILNKVNNLKQNYCVNITLEF